MNYSIKINEFEGPLDLLLHLIKESNIDIYDISIEEITNQYLEYINKMEELNIEIASSYLTMAAELMLLKSKSLLPIKKEEDEEIDESEDTKEKLITRLVEYQKYKEITKDLKTLEHQRKEFYIKSTSNLSNIVDEKIKNDTDIGIDDLLEAFSAFLERKDKEKPLNTKITNKEYSVKLRKNDIKNYLQQRKKAEFKELFNIYNKSYIIVTFISILELAKENQVNLTQEDNFANIYIELKENIT